MDNIKPLSLAIKEAELIEALEKLEISYDDNFKESQQALRDEIQNSIKNNPLISDFKDNVTYWRCECEKINKIKQILQELLDREDELTYTITEETSDVTVFEVDKGGDNPPAPKAKCPPFCPCGCSKKYMTEAV